MGNIIKNLILAFTLVCVIALIVFCIQLIIINSGVDRQEQGSTISNGSQQGNEEPDPGADVEEPQNGQNGNGGENGEGNNDPLVNTPRPPPQGTRYSLLVADDSRLIIYADEDRFDFEQGDTDWWFLYTGGMATLEIRFTMISPQGVAAHAEAFLNEYSGGSGASFIGEESIQGSGLRGYHASAMVGGEVYEAWIHEIDNYDLALVFVINYQNDQQRDALYQVLSSMDME